MQIIWRLELKNNKRIDVLSPWLDNEDKPMVVTNQGTKQEIPIVIVAIRFVSQVNDVYPDGYVESMPAHFQIISGIAGPAGVMPWSGMDIVWAEEVSRYRQEEAPDGERAFEAGPSDTVNAAYKTWWEEVSAKPSEEDEEDEDEEDEPEEKATPAKPAEQAASPT
jgi:hypothetical protein